MSLELAPRPANEEIRAKTVVSTGLIDSPEPELFQIYSDLAKDISGFDKASFSLYDLDFQCPISSTGYEEDRNGQKYARDSLNVCSHVILDSEPLLISDLSKDNTWKNHPKILNGTGSLGYAGFPVINKDNYALGTLCMLNKEPKSLNPNQVVLLKKITANIALLLDLRIEQKEITTKKILDTLINFRKFDSELSIKDFETFMSLTSNLKVTSINAKKLIDLGLCIEQNSNIELTKIGRELLSDMQLRTKPMKKIKLSGSEAENLIDSMFKELK